MEKLYCIYMHTNKLNNKKYIGQTCQKPEYRWGENGKRYVESPVFYAAIQKYGWANFDHQILEDHLTRQEANLKEKYYIALYKTNEKQYGYNLQSGGNSDYVFTEEAKEKCKIHAQQLWSNPEHRKLMSQKMKEKWQDPEYRAKQKIYKLTHIHTMSEEGRKKISEARKKYIAIHGTPTQGKHHTEEAKEKIRQAKLGENNPMYGKHTSELQKQIAREVNSKKIMCVETKMIFNSRKEAAAWCGLKSATGISDQIAGRKKSSGKHPITKEPLHWQEITDIIEGEENNG